MIGNRTLLLLVLFMLLVSACAAPAQPAGSPAEVQQPGPGQPEADAPGGESPADSGQPPAVVPPTQTPEAEPTAEPEEGKGESADPLATPTPLVPLDEIISGGPPPDGIPPIDEPKFVTIESAAEWLTDKEPVIAIRLNGVAKAYPLQIMTWHEIVNDEFAGKPVTVTFCPLCNTALAFDRELNGTIYDFGTSGRLYNSALVMYDRQTGSWWSQVLGLAIVGELTGTQLTFLPAAIVSWADFRTAHPDGLVLSRDTGHSRPYGSNPYALYDAPGNRPFLFRGKIDPRLQAMERVVGVEMDGEAKAYPFSVLAEERAVADKVGGRDIVVFYYPGTASALDRQSIAESRDVGAAAVFDPELDGQLLTFSVDEEGQIVDEQTGSVWNTLGEASSGLMEGKQLTPIVHGNHFWFAWAAFYPETSIYGQAGS
ncbi:MAG: DUF3179 domain-containing protein [Anaerolineae bacterium]